MLCLHQFLERVYHLFLDPFLTALFVHLLMIPIALKALKIGLNICPCLKGAGKLKFRMVVIDIR